VIAVAGRLRGTTKAAARQTTTLTKKISVSSSWASCVAAEGCLRG
jgi:hypothetical protein